MHLRMDYFKTFLYFLLQQVLTWGWGQELGRPSETGREWQAGPVRGLDGLTITKVRGSLLPDRYTDGLVRKRPNSSALTMEIRFFCIKPPIRAFKAQSHEVLC